MREIIQAILEESLAVKRRSIETHSDSIVKAADLLATCIASGHKILIFGNGGSAADAQHLAAEFVNRFVLERPPLPALALTTDTSILTSIGNDYSFDQVFAKQVEALGRKDDVAWAISTSGNSKNVINAVTTARKNGLVSIGMTGRNGQLAKRADLIFRVDSDSTARIQETHITIGHILCELGIARSSAISPIENGSS